MTPGLRPDRARAAVVAGAPVIMLVALVSHPYLARLPDAEAVAGAVQANTTRWAIVHLLSAVGVALVALAFLAVRAQLRDMGEERSSPRGLPLVLFGSAMYGLLPALEFAPLAAAQTGGDVAAVQEELQPWFLAALITGAIFFAAGSMLFARAIADSGILSQGATRLVVPALVVLALSRVIPLGVVQFYVQALAGLAALWPLAHVMWRRPERAAAVPVPRPATAV